MGELSKAKGKFQVMEIKSGGKVKWNDVNDPKASGWDDLMKRKPNKKIPCTLQHAPGELQ